MITRYIRERSRFFGLVALFSYFGIPSFILGFIFLFDLKYPYLRDYFFGSFGDLAVHGVQPSSVSAQAKINRIVYLTRSEILKVNNEKCMPTGRTIDRTYRLYFRCRFPNDRLSDILPGLSFKYSSIAKHNILPVFHEDYRNLIKYSLSTKFSFTRFLQDDPLELAAADVKYEFISRPISEIYYFKQKSVDVYFYNIKNEFFSTHVFADGSYFKLETESSSMNSFLSFIATIDYSETL